MNSFLPAPAQRSLRVLTWGLLAGLPLVFFPDTLDPYVPVRHVWIGLLALGALWTVRKSLGAVWGGFPLVGSLAVGMFTFYGFASIAVAVFPVAALGDNLRWVPVFVWVGIWAWAWGHSPALRKQAWRALPVAVLALGAMRLLQELGWMGAIPAGGHPTSATLGNPNFFDGAMLVLFPGVWVTAARERGIWRVMGIVALQACALYVAWGVTSGVWLAAGAMLVVGLAAVLRLQFSQSWWGRRAGGSFVVLVVVLALAGGGFYVFWTQRVDLAYSQFEFEKVESEEERLFLWVTTVDLIREKPFGVGAGQWHAHILRKGRVGVRDTFGTRFFMQAHNDFLQAFAERGILGGVLFIVLLGWGFWMGWHRLQGRDRWEEVAALCGLTAWAAFAMTNYPAGRPFLLMLLAFYLAMLYRRNWTAAPVHLPTGILIAGWGLKRPERPWGIATGLLVAAGIGLNALWIHGNTLNRKVLQAYAQDDWIALGAYAARARTWYNPHDWETGTPIAWYQGVAALNLGQHRAAYGYFEEAYRALPWHPHTALNHAMSLGDQGWWRSAAHVLEDNLARYPTFDGNRKYLAETYRVLQDTAAFERTIAPFGEKDPRSPYRQYYERMRGAGEE